ncbi:MAG: T9SS type A sorting domain-containing protein, partial [Bacteroidales bacterium]|nr:T9SS type A sorting domain-containing protein [Bacteroidales bacterium]
DNYLWLEDGNNTNDGFPVFVYIEPTNLVSGSEWYYEILNDDGSITYQYLQHTNDTTIQDEPVQIIVKINTLYDKGEHIEKSYEYIFERDGKIYWWNKTLEEFTVLYDYNAQAGDEWEIKVGTQSIVMHVDAVEIYEYEGRLYKILLVSDEGNLFSGMIVCGIGHLTSFFPEKLLNKGYRVEGIRCFWQNGELVFKYGDRDCDEVYEEYHDYGMDEPTGSEGFSIFPNPTDGMIYIVETCHGASLQGQTEYRITNLMGQTLMTGDITTENQQLDVSNLPKGIYFITVGKDTRKIVIR